ncbi:leucine-rich repeat protein [uncultured Ruminococcus sp.]|uniref:leucine-rich repeat protein n=1 Tax=uncultured Ruminococcus sp. TaxID=165186 RepID=UPI0025EF39F2|nr:leucine-rich repeat protein [uncultured Ruminococcus sp.]
MKHTAAKILSVLLSANLLLFSVPFIPVNAAQEMWLDGEADGFQYSIQLNYGYTVIKSVDKDKTGVVEIPAIIADDPITIARGAFRGCKMTELILPDTVTTINSEAFEDCKNLTTIHFPASFTDFHGKSENSGDNGGLDSWIKGCDSLKAFTVSENNPHYKSMNGILYSKDGKTVGPVPPAISFDSINWNGISAIGDFAFCGRETQRTDIEIPSQITSIGDYAFCGYGGSWYDSSYDGTVNIKLNEGLTSIGEYAFSSIYHLEEIDLPDSLTFLGKGAFASDNQLKSMTIPPKVTVIPDSLFEDCLNLESVTLPDGITEIGRLAFYSNKFTSIQLPTSLKKIDDKAFLSSKLSSIVIPNSVEYIGESAFQYSASLKQVKLSKNLKKIEPRSFESCGLDSLEIPEGVTEIGEEAFAYGALTSLKLPETLTKIGNGAFRNGFLWSDYNSPVKIPEHVTEIGGGAFFNCYLSDIELPNHSISCGFEAFGGNYLSSVVFPEGMTSMTVPVIMGSIYINRIYLPKSLKELSPLAIAKDGYMEFHTADAPYDADSYFYNNLVPVSEIYFAGTETEWNALIKDWDFAKYNTDPSVMDNVTVHFNATVGTDVAGDVNADGIFSIADLIMMQQWLYCQGRLINWKAGDLYKDNTINGLDLCLMRQMLLDAPSALHASITDLVWDAESRMVTANVTYENLPERSDAWIGVVPSDAPHNEKAADSAVMQHQSLLQFESGYFAGFELSDTSLSGNYDLRIYANDNGGKELACVTFYIDGPKAEIANVQWNPDTRTVTADVNYANFSDDNSAWIGVVPSDTPHNEQDADRVDVNYISLRDFESGAFPGITVPNDISGSYDLRIYSSDYNGTELACVNVMIT